MLAVSGGVRVNVGGFRLSAHSPVPTGVLALLGLGAWFVLAKRAGAIGGDLSDLSSLVERRASVLIAAIALASGATVIVFATWSASGADASGYLSEAAQWASGRLLRLDPLSTQLQVAFERGVTSPLGWRPSAIRGWQAPTYPPGLPLLMAVPYLVGGASAACLVVSASATIAVWATGALAMEMAGSTAGVMAAFTLAATPVFLYQAIQPMSDVPVTAAWILCWLLIVKRSNWAGLACAIAVLVRPNLAPLALIPFLATRGSRVRFAVPVAVAGIALAVLQWHWYGSPLRSGYGTADELFAVHNVATNVSRYFGWMLDTSPVILLAGFGWWLTRRRPWVTPLAVFASLVLAAYLVYAVFDDWSYLRFLLPAIAVGSVFVGALVAEGVRRVLPFERLAIGLATLLVVLALGLAEARSRNVFHLADDQHRIVQIAGALATRLGPADVIVSGEQSGSMRFYTGKEIVRWDALAANEWNGVEDTLSLNGHGIWIVLDGWEEPLFRSTISALDWPPAIEAGETHRTRAWRLSDRARFAAGENVITERIR